MFFSLTNGCTFILSLFKISGMESKYIVAQRDGAEAASNIRSVDIIDDVDDSNIGTLIFLQFLFYVLWYAYFVYAFEK